MKVLAHRRMLSALARIPALSDELHLLREVRICSAPRIIFLMGDRRTRGRLGYGRFGGNFRRRLSRGPDGPAPDQESNGGGDCSSSACGDRISACHRHPPKRKRGRARRWETGVARTAVRVATTPIP